MLSCSKLLPQDIPLPCHRHPRPGPPHSSPPYLTRTYPPAHALLREFRGSAHGRLGALQRTAETVGGGLGSERSVGHATRILGSRGVQVISGDESGVVGVRGVDSAAARWIELWVEYVYDRFFALRQLGTQNVNLTYK